MQAVRVPPAFQQARTKEQLARELLDQVRSEGLLHHAVVADAGDGLSVDFRGGLAERGESSGVGVTGKEAVVAEPPTGLGRACGHAPRSAT